MAGKEDKKQGWQGRGKACPHKDKSITVEPLRDTDDIKAIKEYLKDRPRDLAIFTLGINTGLRGKDILSLKYKTILRADGSLRKRISIRESKTKKIKKFILSIKVRSALATLIPDDTDEIDLNQYVFPSRKLNKKGTYRMSIQRLHQLVNQWADGAGIEGHFGSHTLRKTFSYFLLKKGADIHLLMKILNHSSPAVTLRYAGIEQEDIDKVIFKLNL